MKVTKAKTEDIRGLIPVAVEWRKTCNGKGFGIDLVLETHLSDLAGLIERDDADLLLLSNDKDEIVGYMGLICFSSPVGNQKIAEEHYWFVAGRSRGRGTMLLIRKAKEWAKEKGCSHIIFNASNLASNMHDKICVFYKKIGLRKFETSFIGRI